jgi:hypothetical protein
MEIHKTLGANTKRSLKGFRPDRMLPFLLPNSIFCARATTNRASSSLALLATKSRLVNRTKFHTNSRLFADDATEEYKADEDESSADIDGDFDGELGARNQGEHVRWLMTEGAEFRRPKPDGPNWLGGNVVCVLSDSIFYL